MLTRALALHGRVRATGFGSLIAKEPVPHMKRKLLGTVDGGRGKKVARNGCGEHLQHVMKGHLVPLRFVEKNTGDPARIRSAGSGVRASRSHAKQSVCAKPAKMLSSSSLVQPSRPSKPSTRLSNGSGVRVFSSLAKRSACSTPAKKRSKQSSATRRAASSSKVFSSHSQPFLPCASTRFQTQRFKFGDVFQ